MLWISLLLFAAVLLVLGVAASRGLGRLDDILEITGPDEAAPGDRSARR